MDKRRITFNVVGIEIDTRAQTAKWLCYLWPVS